MRNLSLSGDPSPKTSFVRSFVRSGRVNVRRLEETRRTSEMVPQHDDIDSSGNSHSTETLFKSHVYTGRTITFRLQSFLDCIPPILNLSPLFAIEMYPQLFLTVSRFVMIFFLKKSVAARGRIYFSVKLL
jgi:hypothetical protein